MDYMNKAYKMYDELTKEYMSKKSINEIKENSIYFTPLTVANNLFKDVIINKNDTINILDTSCGNGILILKLIDVILSFHTPKILNIHVFDIDPILISNVESIFNQIKFEDKDIEIKVEYYCQDYLKSHINIKFDYVVMNPPYKKVRKTDVPDNLSGVIIGQPNLYHLFIIKALDALNKDGVLCILSPKNYLSGKYTQNLRQKIFSNFNLCKIHTFNNRHTFFDVKITQEVCIAHITKKHCDNVIVSYNGGDSMNLPLKELILDSNTNILQTPRNIYDYNLIKKFKKFPRGIIGTELLMKTGKVVQFRVKNKFLSEFEFKQVENGVPLIVYRHINTGSLNYNELFNKSRNKSITIYNNSSTESLLIDNRNYVILRKNIDKKYKKLINCIPYVRYLQTDKIGIDNGLIYITNKNDDLTETEVRGIQCIFMSKQFDDYYRMINSSHTLNVYEFENIHFPDMDTIRKIGLELCGNDVSVELATKIMENYL